MGESGEKLAARPDGYFPATQALLDLLGEEPTAELVCSHGGEPAVGVYEVPRGCVALPGQETQLLCPQHVLTDGSFEGMVLVVDLSVNAAWSQERADQPDFWMRQEQEGGPIGMVSTEEYPLVA